MIWSDWDDDEPGCGPGCILVVLVSLGLWAVLFTCVYLIITRVA